jgi:hypothetical protein
VFDDIEAQDAGILETERHLVGALGIDGLRQ